MMPPTTERTAPSTFGASCSGYSIPAPHPQQLASAGSFNAAVNTSPVPFPLVQRNNVVGNDVEPTAAFDSAAGPRTSSPHARADATTSAVTKGRGELAKLLLPALTPAPPPRMPEPSDVTLNTVPYDDRSLSIVLFLAVYLDQSRNPNRAIYQQSYPLPLSDDDATAITTFLIYVLATDNEVDRTIRAYSSRREEGFRSAPLATGFGDSPPRSLEVVRTILTDMIAGDVNPETKGVACTESLAAVDLHGDPRVARRVRGYLNLTSRLVLCDSALRFGVSTTVAPVDCPVRAIPVVLAEASSGDTRTVCRWANFVGDADAVAAARWFYPDLDHELNHGADGNAPLADGTPADSRNEEEQDLAAVRPPSVPPEPDLPAPLAELTSIDGNLCIVLFVAVYCDMRSNPTRPIYQQALSLPLSDSAVTQLTDALLDILATGSNLDRRLRSLAPSSALAAHVRPWTKKQVRNTLVECATHPRKLNFREVATLAQNSPHRAPKIIERIRDYLTIWVPAMVAAEGSGGVPFATPAKPKIDYTINAIPCIFEVAAGVDRASSLPLPLRWAVAKPDATAAAQFLFPDLESELRPHATSRSVSRSSTRLASCSPTCSASSRPPSSLSTLSTPSSRTIGVDGGTEMNDAMSSGDSSGPHRSRFSLDDLTVLDGNFCIALFVAVCVDRLYHPQRAIYEQSFSLPISDDHFTELVGVLCNALTTGHGTDRRLVGFEFVRAQARHPPTASVANQRLGHERTAKSMLLDCLALDPQSSKHERQCMQKRRKVPALHCSPVVLAKIQQYVAVWAPALLDAGGLPFCSASSSSAADEPPFTAIPCIFADAGGTSVDAAEHRSVRWATMTEEMLSAAHFLCPGLDIEIVAMPDADLEANVDRDVSMGDLAQSPLVLLPPPPPPPVLADLTTVDGNLCIALFVATHMNRLLCPDQPILRESYTLPLTDDVVANLTKVLTHALTAGNGLDRILRAFQGLKPNTTDPHSSVLIRTLSKRVSARFALVDCIVVHETVFKDKNARRRFSCDDVHASPVIAGQIRRYLTEWLPALLEHGGMPFRVPGDDNAGGTIFPVFDRVSDDAGQVSIRWAESTAERSDAVQLLNLKFHDETNSASSLAPLMLTLPAPKLPPVLRELRPIDGNLCIALFVAVACDAHVHPKRAIYQQTFSVPMPVDVVATMTAALVDILTAGVGMKRTIRAFPMRHAGQDPDALRATAELPNYFKVVRLLLAQLARPALRTDDLAGVSAPHRAPAVADRIRRYLVDWTPALVAAGGLPFRTKTGKTSSEYSTRAIPCIFDQGIDEVSGEHVLRWAVTAPHKQHAARDLYPKFDQEVGKRAAANLGDDKPVDGDTEQGLSTNDGNLCIALFAAAALEDQHQNLGARPIDHDEYPVPLDAAHVASLADRLVALLGTALNSRITAFAIPEYAARILAINGTLQKRRTVRTILNELVERESGPAAMSKTPQTHEAVRDRIEQYLTVWVPGLTENDGTMGFPIPAGVVDIDAIPSVLEVVVNADGQRVMRWTDLAALGRAAAAAFCHDLALGDSDNDDHDVDDRAGPASRTAARTQVRHAPATSVPADDRLLASPWTLANFAMLVWSAVADDVRHDPNRAIYSTSFHMTTDDGNANRHDLVAHLAHCCMASAAHVVLQAPPPGASHTDLVPMTLPEAQDLAVNPTLKQGRRKQVALEKLVGAYLTAALGAVRSSETWMTPAGVAVPCVLARDPGGEDRVVWNVQLAVAAEPVTFWAPDGAEPVGHKQMRQMGKAERSARTPTPAVVGQTTARGRDSTPRRDATPRRDLVGLFPNQVPARVQLDVAVDTPDATRALADQCHAQLCALVDRLAAHMLATLNLPANYYNTAAILAAWETHVKNATADAASLALARDTNLEHLAQFLAASLASQLATEFSARVGAVSDPDAASICHAAHAVRQCIQDLAASRAAEPIYLSDLYDNAAPWAQAMHAALDATWELLRTVNVHRAPGLAVDIVRDAVLELVVVCATLARVHVRVEFPPLGGAFDAERMAKVGPPMFTGATRGDGNDTAAEAQHQQKLLVVAAITPWLTRTDDGTRVVPLRAEVMCGRLVLCASDHNRAQRDASAAAMGDSAVWTIPDTPAAATATPVKWTAAIGSRSARTDSPSLAAPARLWLTPVDRTPRPPVKRVAKLHVCADCGLTTERQFKMDPETGRAQCRRCRQRDLRRARKKGGATATASVVELDDVVMAEAKPDARPALPLPACVRCGTTGSQWWRTAPRGGLLCTACAAAGPAAAAGAGKGVRQRARPLLEVEEEEESVGEDMVLDGGEDEEDGGAVGEGQDGPLGGLLDDDESSDDNSDGEYTESTAPAAKRRRVSGAPRSR
ncbi:hypothetical protein AMAG_08624 [Allomyces macrogynus ATCC 38327]|uniref:GATA-type domain-containing protein n=1 Tax=Allomyces macrogynus (strain ATCC 38327) TaxID=578462 RepID=A0A0L0SLW7_ALLM3|nr:hypothetical protein AMAG_08624 [Allomyces macrogynus ATCC 38327]|eukprot:KNE63502.1 hypothetical protein AMAG_08624 [Allomyces macrogynus ATCC 38327]